MTLDSIPKLPCKPAQHPDLEPAKLRPRPDVVPGLHGRDLVVRVDQLSRQAEQVVHDRGRHVLAHHAAGGLGLRRGGRRGRRRRGVEVECAALAVAVVVVVVGVVALGGGDEVRRDGEGMPVGLVGFARVAV